MLKYFVYIIIDLKLLPISKGFFYFHFCLLHKSAQLLIFYIIADQTEIIRD